jgi:hypothetical protein
MLSGDVNLDGKVDWGDLDAYLRAWAEGDEVTADVDRDGEVTGHDLMRMMEAVVGWAKPASRPRRRASCPPVTGPGWACGQPGCRY